MSVTRTRVPSKSATVAKRLTACADCSRRWLAHTTAQSTVSSAGGAPTRLPWHTSGSSNGDDPLMRFLVVQTWRRADGEWRLARELVEQVSGDGSEAR